MCKKYINNTDFYFSVLHFIHQNRTPRELTEKHSSSIFI